MLRDLRETWTPRYQEERPGKTFRDSWRDIELKWDVHQRNMVRRIHLEILDDYDRRRCWDIRVRRNEQKEGENLSERRETDRKESSKSKR